MPFFSVIVPTYNRMHSLGQTIQSILNQSFLDFEIIIVDDGSTDDTKRITQDYIDQRVQYLFQENRGVCSARNLGASYATGNYLAFLDSDDHVTKDWLVTFYNIASSRNCDIIFCNIRKVWNGNDKSQIVDARDRFAKGQVGFFLAGSFCITKELFHIAGEYDPALSYGENTELGFRLIACNPDIDFTDTDSLIYEVSRSKGSQNLLNKIDSTIIVLEKHKGLISRNRNLERVLVQVIGVCYLKTNQLQKARQYLLRAYALNPLNLKSMIRILVTYVPFVSRKIYQKAG